MTVLFLRVHDNGTDWPTKSRSTLWVREVALEGTPAVGDKMFMLADVDEPEGTVIGYVKDRYWHFDGPLVIELQDIVHLPTKEFDVDFIQRQGRGVRALPTTWRQDEEDRMPLAFSLVLAGWTRWEEWRSRRHVTQVPPPTDR